MLYADKNLDPVHDGKLYTTPDGTQYPRNFPKAEIPNLTLVAETPRPENPALNVLGFHINAGFVQIWDTKPKSAEELAADTMRVWENEMSDFDDVMPDFMEDHITHQHGGLTGDPFTQGKYDEKISKRASKPQE